MDVVSLQLTTHVRYQENLDTLIALVEQHKDKAVIVAPEVCLTGFDYAHMETVAKFSILALKSLKKIIDKQILVLTLILKENRITSYNVCYTKLLRIPAMENVALWHERDISHSSTERFWLPDAFITTDFMLHRMNSVIANLIV